MNEFAPPSDECFCPARVFPPRVVQFTLKSAAAVITAMLIGGKTAHRHALLETYLIGGRPVDLSIRGELIYFLVGCIGGAACAIGGMICMQHIQYPYAVPEAARRWRGLLFIPFTMTTGIVGGAILCFVFKLLLCFTPNNTVLLFVNAPQ
jgi:hypothetical protein